jgi:hypothetical protein
MRQHPFDLGPQVSLGALWAQGPAVAPRCSRTGLTALPLRPYRYQHGTSNAAFGRADNRDEIELTS